MAGNEQLVEAGNSSANGNQIHFHGLNITQGLCIAAMAALAVGLGVGAIVVAVTRNEDVLSRYEENYRQLSMQSALTERRYKDMETYALLNGWKVPKDDQHGPLGNLERLKGDKK